MGLRHIWTMVQAEHPQPFRSSDFRCGGTAYLVSFEKVRLESFEIMTGLSVPFVSSHFAPEFMGQSLRMYAEQSGDAYHSSKFQAESRKTRDGPVPALAS